MLKQFKAVGAGESTPLHGQEETGIRGQIQEQLSVLRQEALGELPLGGVVPYSNSFFMLVWKDTISFLDQRPSTMLRSYRAVTQTVPSPSWGACTHTVCHHIALNF